jgi:hypothetical protein
MKEIKLSQRGRNKGKFVALVDDSDFEYLNQFKWYAQKDKTTYYVKRYEKNIMIYMHRLIMNTPKGMQVDHKDHDGLNCQKNNMRNCIRSQNMRNRKAKINGTSNYLGVHINRGKYIVAHIRINGKEKHLGTFKTIEEAATARDKASIKYFGEFAYLNFKRL